jgi:hypothetical protein
VVDGTAVFNFEFGRYCQVGGRVGKTAISSRSEFIGAVADNGPARIHHLAEGRPLADSSIFE